MIVVAAGSGTRLGLGLPKAFVPLANGTVLEAALGGIRDRSSLALTAGRMRSDTIFRDAAHHFLRQFDRCFQTFERAATDQDIADLADTRTARAFMLFGRVTGVFD